MALTKLEQRIAVITLAVSVLGTTSSVIFGSYHVVSDISTAKEEALWKGYVHHRLDSLESKDIAIKGRGC